MPNGTQAPSAGLLLCCLLSGMACLWGRLSSCWLHREPLLVHMLAHVTRALKCSFFSWDASYDVTGMYQYSMHKCIWLTRRGACIKCFFFASSACITTAIAMAGGSCHVSCLGPTVCQILQLMSVAGTSLVRTNEFMGAAVALFRCTA